MLSSDIPAKFVQAFAKNATGTYKRAIPNTTGDANAASLNLGFPPNTFVDEGAGGKPPDGRDFNGLLNQDTAWAWWQAAGGAVLFDSAFSTAVGGYPKYAVLASTTLGRLWQSQVDNNTTNPDSGPSANWKVFGGITGGGPGLGYRISADGFIEQWGSASIPAGGNAVNFSFTFPTPFLSEVHGPWGNAQFGANGSWTVASVVFPSVSLTGASVTVDSANAGQAFAGGNVVRWNAHGY